MNRTARWLRASAAVGLLGTAFGYYASASASIARVQAMRGKANLAVPAQARALRALGEGEVRRAVAAQPLAQGLVNVAMARRSELDGASFKLGAWTGALRRLGWRDTPALQNLLYADLRRGDLGNVIEVSDALLRRDEVRDQAVALFNVAELDPVIRADIARRLIARPSWRPYYLYNAGVLVRPDQIQARSALLSTLLDRGDHLTRTEIAPNVAAMERGGRPDLAFSLWRAAVPGVERPLNDPGFREAATAGDDDPTAFEWRFGTGEGYDIGPYPEAGAAAVELRWNGRGVPVFASQRTSGPAARYGLVVGVDRETLGDLGAVGFRLVCGADVTEFVAAPGTPGRFSTAKPTPCPYPVFEMFGRVQPRTADRSVVLRRLTLRTL